jgi:hypothetical protein
MIEFRRLEYWDQRLQTAIVAAQVIQTGDVAEVASDGMAVVLIAQSFRLQEPRSYLQDLAEEFRRKVAKSRHLIAGSAADRSSCDSCRGNMGTA